ncbi:MAG: helix-turn-helix transcriptional regulator [Clostridia bacterium]|nr:helix-turn-helix transcriptional regulator [Clostridia bacterium]MDD4375274.1 helix-turn-helix transcriptional regulator [Clostridia bacterium]
MNYIKLGQKIKYERLINRLTQEGLGELTDITSSYVGQIERGERKLTIGKLVRIANVLNVSVDYLLFDDEEKDLGKRGLKDKLEVFMKKLKEKDKEMVIDIIKVVSEHRE